MLKINKRKEIIEKAGLVWNIVESVPVHEYIKTQADGFEKYIDKYKSSIENLADSGIKNITYNFMPVLDWTRAYLSYEMADGSKALRFKMAAFAAFDLFLLQRSGAWQDYDIAIKDRTTKRFASLNDEEKVLLQRNIIAGLPGSEERFSIQQFQQAWDAYHGVHRKKLQQHLTYFLQHIIPVAETGAVVMSIHPDDPPYTVLGLPRVVSNSNDIHTLIDAVSSLSNRLVFLQDLMA